MTPVVLTPSPAVVVETAALVLSDGQTDLDLLGSPPWGLYLVEFTPPVVPRENTYALAPEGQRRIRSRPQNAVGSARVRIDRTEESSETWQADLYSLQEMVESAHKRKGTLTFTPPNLQEVTYDLESCQITEAPADGPRMTQRMQEFVIEFECRPYGRLETITAFTAQPLTGPIAGIEIDAEDVTGHVDAFAELTLTDASNANADFVEFGLGQQGYDPDAPLLIEEDDYVLSGFVGTQPGGAGTQIETTLTDEAVACCGTGIQTHGGRQKIAAVVGTPDDDVWVRLGWRLDAGSLSYGRWIEVSSAVAEQEHTLAVIDVGEATRWQGQIEAFAGGGSGTLEIHQMYVIPAEVCGRIRGTTDDHALWEDNRCRFTQEAAYRDSSAGLLGRWRLDGDTLRIPVATASALPSILVVRRRLYDIDSGLASDGRDADVTATLEITPRVTLY